ncbi:HAD hydrolase-like protein [Halanaerobacter jeridensis]|uniref:Hydrolase of the HAD superfamily n=1 Tax=Halanaerobacter jeridensis TaxID=706427 RepID=A0A938XRP1_9FIRM|nr:HAD hydrolase-like protein [Halanaerobacter jeridensis]MBM7556210.1 putative hydrolase of the HAD superfamily [Halanaerobacter jeridensis]
MKQVLLFDLGGVVSETKFERVLDKYAQKYNWNLAEMKENIFSEEYMALLAGKMNLEEFSHWLAGEIEELSIPELKEFVTEYYYSEEPKEEVVNLIERIDSQYQLGLVTNDIGRLDEKLAYLNLTGVFDKIINSSQVGYCKPQVEIYQSALEKFDVKGEKVIYIDNDPVCLNNAASLGIKAIKFVNAQQLENRLSELGIIRRVG